MKTILKIEELAQFILGIALFSMLPYKWWLFLALLFLPDLGMLGYLINKKTGAMVYNLFHHKGIAIFLGLLGLYLAIPLLMLGGVIFFSHASLDRILGYGLKYPNSFNNTHLGRIGK